MNGLQTVRILERESSDIDVVDAADESPDTFARTWPRFFALTGVVDAPVTAAVANRTNWRFRQTAGWIANEIVFRDKLNPKERVSEFLARLGDCVDEGLNYQDVPYDLVLESIAHDFPGQPTALDQVSFRLNAPPRNSEFGYNLFMSQAPGYKMTWAGYEIQIVGVDVDDCVRDLEFVARVSDDAITLFLACRGDVFSPAAGQRILDLYSSILTAMMNDPERRSRRSYRNSRRLQLS